MFDTTDEFTDIELWVLDDCDLLRQVPPLPVRVVHMLVEEWERLGVPATVPELEDELRKAKARLAMH
jgi:hypothetical protein